MYARYIMQVTLGGRDGHFSYWYVEGEAESERLTKLLTLYCFLFLLMLQKALLFPFGPMCGRGLWGGCLVIAGRGSGRSQTPGEQRGPSKASGLLRLLVMLEGEPLKETPAQPSQGAPSLQREPGVTHLLDAFHLLTQDAALQEVVRLRGWAGRDWAGRTRACRSKGPGSGSSPRPGWLPWCPECHPSSETASARPGSGCGH